MAQWQNTVYTEHAPDSPNERFGLGASSQTRQFDITNGSFTGRMQAAYDILGYAAVVASGSAKVPYYLSRVNPMPAPARPAASYQLRADAVQTLAVPDMTNQLWANGISRIEPLGSAAGVDLQALPPGTAAANYNRARLAVEFSTLPYQIKPDSAVLAIQPDGITELPDEGQTLQGSGWAATRYITRVFEPFSRLLIIPFGMEQINFPNAMTALEKVGMPLREGGANVSYTWMRVPLTGPVPGLNFDAANKLLGSINDQKFDVFPAKTLLFDSFSTREYQGFFGERLADVRYNFIFLPHPSNGSTFNGGAGAAVGAPQGWNSVYSMIPDSKIADYFPVASVGGQPPFTLASTIKAPDGYPLSFADLFRPTRQVPQ